MDAAFGVLVVCRANVCRSPRAEALLARAVEQAGLSDLVTVGSAGTHAPVGEPACVAALDGSTASVETHRSRIISAELLRRADLILTADRESRSECALLDPACRPRMFTLNQAAVLADSLAAALAAGLPIDGAPPMPTQRRARLAWLVEELDAARPHLSGRPEGSDDIEDRHGPAPHSDVFDEVDAAVGRIVEVLVAVAR